METTKITEYNPQALKKNYIEFSDSKKEPVFVQLNFENYYHLNSKVHALLYAIESIGANDDKENIATCAVLAELCRKLLPSIEIEFLDDLLIKKENRENNFIKV